MYMSIGIYKSTIDTSMNEDNFVGRVRNSDLGLGISMFQHQINIYVERRQLIIGII